MWMRGAITSAMFALIVLVQAAPAYSATIFETSVSGINNAGIIVGSYTDATGSHGFTLHNGAYVSFDHPAGLGTTQFIAINSSGSILGRYSDANSPFNNFIYSNGVFNPVGSHPGGSSVALGLADDGSIIGNYGSAGYIYSNGVYTSISNPLSAGGQTVVLGISTSGEVVGSYNLFNTPFHYSFTYAGGVFTPLPEPPGAMAGNTIARAINSHSEIVGHYRSAGFHPHAFFFDGSTFVNIDDLSHMDVTPLGMNDHGDIVGYYYNQKGRLVPFLRTGQAYEAITFPYSGLVPEPDAWLLMMLGFLGVGAVLRLQRRRLIENRTAIHASAR